MLLNYNDDTNSWPKSQINCSCVPSCYFFFIPVRIQSMYLLFCSSNWWKLCIRSQSLTLDGNDMGSIATQCSIHNTFPALGGFLYFQSCFWTNNKTAATFAIVFHCNIFLSGYHLHCRVLRWSSKRSRRRQINTGPLYCHSLFWNSLMPFAWFRCVREPTLREILQSNNIYLAFHA